MNEQIKQFRFFLPNIGEQVRQWRVSRYMTQAELEQKAGLGHNAVSRIECEAVSPRIDTIERLANALDLSTEQLQFQKPVNQVQEKVTSFGGSDSIDVLINALEKVPEPKRSRLLKAFMDLIKIAVEEEDA